MVNTATHALILIDSHCHLDCLPHGYSLEQIISKAQLQGVQRFLVPGLEPAQFSTLIQVQQAFPVCDIAAGIHPHFIHSALQKAESLDAVLLQLSEIVDTHKNKIVALGEMGIDGSIDLPLKTQETVLRQQLRLAKAYQLPVILHHRQSHNDLIRILKSEGGAFTGVLHAFSGSLAIAESYLNIGLLLGVGATITYPRAKKTRKSVAALDLSCILLETDTPDMPVNGFQGQANTPAQLTYVCDALSQLKECSQEQIMAQTSTNYYRVFH